MTTIVLQQSWPIIRREGLERDAIRALSLAVPLFGSFGLLWLKQVSDRNRLSEQDDKRRVRMLQALRAELALNAVAQYKQFNPETRTERHEKFNRILHDDKNTHSMPMATVSKTIDVYEVLKPEIADLPEQVIAAVVSWLPGLIGGAALLWFLLRKAGLLP